ncbi:MAG: fructose 1,6-bisphosphatase, partial [Gaiellaceae bacterium]
MSRVTISAIKADVGGYVGHGDVHPDILVEAQRHLDQAMLGDLLIDGRVGACGDDVNFVLTHEHGVDSAAVHGWAWEAFESLTEVATR